MAAALGLAGQTDLNSLSSVVSVRAPEKIVGKRNTTQDVEFTIRVRNGFHINSNTPSDEYLIPLRFTFTDGGVQAAEVKFPSPKMQTFAFSNKPMSVFEGDIKAIARVKVGSAAGTLNGKLRYQACNDRMCLPPRTLDIKVPVEIRN